MDRIKDFYGNENNDKKPLLKVGFNRRFSRYAQEIEKHIEKRINPLYIYYRINAGYLPPDHWVHECSGRIIEEACHLLDMMTSLTVARITSVFGQSVMPTTERDNRCI